MSIAFYKWSKYREVLYLLSFKEGEFMFSYLYMKLWKHHQYTFRYKNSMCDSRMINCVRKIHLVNAPNTGYTSITHKVSDPTNPCDNKWCIEPFVCKTCNIVSKAHPYVPISINLESTNVNGFINFIYCLYNNLPTQSEITWEDIKHEETIFICNSHTYMEMWPTS